MIFNCLDVFPPLGGRVSLSTLLVDAPHLTDVLETTLGVETETVEALLDATVNPGLEDFVSDALFLTDVHSGGKMV